MTHKEMWEELKRDVESAVEEGYMYGYNDPKAIEYDQFYIYQYINDKMNRLEKEI